MSTWKEITDKNDIEINGDDINILISSDQFGNNYIHLKKQMLIDLLPKPKLCGTCKGKDDCNYYLNYPDTACRCYE